MNPRDCASNEKIETQVIFSLGSNCGDKETNVDEAINWLKTWVKNSATSHIYSTPDCHGGCRHYVNAVMSGTTVLSHEEAELKCKSHEEKCGRDCECRQRGDVPIDIDIVVWGSDIIRPKDFGRQHFKIGYERIIQKIQR